MPYPDDEHQSTDLREFFAVLRRRKWSVILPTLLVVGVALASVYARTPQYSSTARVEVLPKTAEGVLQPSYGNQFMNMDTESARVTSTPIQSGAADLLVQSGQSAALATEAGVSVAVPANTTYLDITCTTGDPATAQACAQAYADAYVADRTASVNEAVAVLRRPIEGFEVSSNGNGKVYTPEPEPEAVPASLDRPDQEEGESEADLQAELRSVLEPARESEPEREALPMPEPPRDRDMWR